MISSGIDGFNKNCSRTVAPSNEKVIDETMSAFRPQTRKYGDLPFLSYIARKPEPLGMEMKVVADCKTGIMLWMELQRGKLPMRSAQFAVRHGVTASVAMRGCKATTLQPSTNLPINIGLEPKQFLYGDSWFSSVETTI